MLLSFVQVFTILAATAQAVDVGGFTTLGCRQRALSTCLNWPQGTCCEFVSHRSRPSNDHLATQSVGMQNLHECDLGTWNWPANNAHSHGNPSGQCGTVRDRVLGPASTACMSEVSRHSSTGDGAMWFNIVQSRHGQCPPAGSIKANVGYYNKLGKNLFTSLSKGGKARRDATKTEYLTALDEALRTDPDMKCKGKIYADVLGWTNGTGVWVMEGSQRNHKLYTNASGTHPHLDHNGWMEKAGAQYFEHWNQHPISHAVQTNHGQNDPDGQKGKRSFTGKKWVTGTGLVDDESVAKRDVELDTESFPWIPESGEDEGVNKRSQEEEAHESFPWIPESEEDEEDNGVSKRDAEEEEHESFPWIQ